MKVFQAATDAKLRKLFERITDYPELQRLKNTLKYLMLNQYDADVETMKGFFDGTFGTDELIAAFEGK